MVFANYTCWDNVACVVGWNILAEDIHNVAGCVLNVSCAEAFTLDLGCYDYWECPFVSWGGVCLACHDKLGDAANLYWVCDFVVGNCLCAVLKTCLDCISLHCVGAYLAECDRGCVFCSGCAVD